MLIRVILLTSLLLPLRAQTQVAPLSSPRDIRSLDRTTAAQAIPVSVKGVITFASPRKDGSFIVDDGTTGIYVAATDAAARGLQKPEQDFEGGLQVGMLVVVSGVTAPGGFAPVIIPRRVRLLGRAPLPPVKPVSVADLQTGRFDCERVQVRGVIQHAEISNRLIDAARLELAAVGGHFVAYALNPEGIDPAKLVDAEVELSGVALSFFNERAEFVGARVQIGGAGDVAVLREAPASPFDVPQVSLELLQPFSPNAPELHRRRVTGVVTVAKPGSYFYVQEGERAVRVSTRSPDLLSPGDRVEVSGFVELSNYFAEIREAVFRKTGTGSVPNAEPVTRNIVLTSKPWLEPPKSASHLDGRRVSLRGRLEKVESSEEAARRLTLDCEGHAVFVTVINEGGEGMRERLVPGSELEVTGVCQIQLSAGRPTVSNPVPTGFQILAHSPEDVAVLAVPPWWNPQRLWLALGSTAGVLALALGWAWLLRRKVRQRSAQLATEIGARRHAAVEFDATLRERKRLAADLHDTLEQALTGLALQLEAVDLFHKTEPGRSTHHLHLARQFLARSREDVRRSVWNLRAQGLEGRTLTEALEAMVTTLTAAHPVQSKCERDGEPVALPDFIAGNLLLLAQEAVTNALKHAQPKTLGVRVVFTPLGVTLSVADDGVGFDPDRAPGLQEGHFGLQGMRERIKRLGGKLDIESSPGRGTRISAFVPTHAFDAALDN